MATRGGRKRRVVMLMVAAAATKPSGSRSYFPLPSVPGRFRETLPGHRLASAREDTGRSISCACPLALSLLRKGPPVDVWGSRNRTHEAKARLLRVGAVSAGTLLLFCVPELRGEL